MTAEHGNMKEELNKALDLNAKNARQYLPSEVKKQSEKG